MRIAQFNTFPYGGAATAAIRVHHQLRLQEVDSQFYYHRNEKSELEAAHFHQVDFSPPKYNGWTGPIQKRTDRKRLKEIYRQYNDHIALRREGQETFSMAQLPDKTQLDWESINSDLVHLHWISFFADYPSFFDSIPDTTPIVWTLHDMNAFTGGCHYANACGRYRFGCGGCPQIANSGPKDVSAASFAVKQKSLRSKSVHVATPSDWMRELAKQSKIWPANTTFQTIRLGFDLQVFRPISKSLARKQLGVAEDAIVIGFGAEDVNNKRKGMHHLWSALSKIEIDEPVECLVFGSGKVESNDRVRKVHSLGYVDSESQQALIYSASDIVVVPSREDNQPQVGLEAMACGTPVVAFNSGGIPEYVRDGITGLLAQVGNEPQLAERISWLANNAATRQTMGHDARLMMESEFEIGQQTQKYFDLYRRAIGHQRSISRAA